MASFFPCSSKKRSNVQQQPQDIQKPQVPYFGMWDGLEDETLTEAFQHVETKTDPEDRSSQTLNRYTEAVQKVIEPAKSIYVVSPENPLPQNEVLIHTMIMRGSFSLQVVLWYLGGSESLDYRLDHPIFGKNGYKQIRDLVKSMFGLKNQLPLDVLNELMTQNFFKKVVDSREWRRPEDLPGRVLYDFLLFPALNSGKRGSIFAKNKNKLLMQQKQTPTLIHALWLQTIGPGGGNGSDDGANNTIYQCVPNVSALHSKGIRFKSSNEMGIRGIEFKKRFLFSKARLYLQTIFIEMESLVDYEENTEFDENRRQVCEYLLLISELIGSLEDAYLLSSQGIIHGNREQVKDMVSSVKSQLEEEPKNPKLRLVRKQICDYEPIANMAEYIAGLSLLSGVTGTVFSAWGLFRNKN